MSGNPAAFLPSAFLNSAFQTGGLTPVTSDDRTKYGGREADWERYKAQKRLEKLTARREEIRPRLVKAEQEVKRKNPEAKSGKAVALRIENLTSEMRDLNDEINQLIGQLELSILDRKRRLLLLTLVM